MKFNLKINLLIRVLFILVTIIQFGFIGYILFYRAYVQVFILFFSIFITVFVLVGIYMYDRFINSNYIILRENSLYIISPYQKVRIPYEAINKITYKPVILPLQSIRKLSIHYDQKLRIHSALPKNDSLFFNTIARKNKKIVIDIPFLADNEEEYDEKKITR